MMFSGLIRPDAARKSAYAALIIFMGQVDSDFFFRQAMSGEEKNHGAYNIVIR